MNESKHSAARSAAAESMTAWVAERYGAPSFRRREVPRPALRPGHVLIEVAATSINPVDAKIRAGAGSAVAPTLPAVLHGDVAGTVAAVGEGVADLAVGDRVYGCAGGLKDIPGALADYMLADARLIAKAPDSLDLQQAAALPLVVLTAFEGLHWKASLQAGESVLVHGGAGGVGHVAIQVAKAAGARVTATASTADKREIARSFGADHVIDYRAETPAEYVARLTAGRGFDLVFDAAGGKALADSFVAARPNGRIVSIQTRGQYELGPMTAKGLSLHVVLMLLPMLTGEGRERHRAILDQARTMVDEGRLRPLLDASDYSFDEAAQAHRRLEAGEHVGKIVLRHPGDARTAG